MVIVPLRYRGTREYLLVYCHLISAAKSNQTVRYGEIAQIMGLQSAGHHMAAETGWMVGEISEDEHRNGRPMLSALVVRQDTKKPGDGFFELAEQLGKLPMNSTKAQKDAFWQRELQDVFSTW